MKEKKISWAFGSEGAHFWLSIFNELKARGVEDILIASVDGLTRMRDAIATVFPKIEIQLCVVHTIRNSLKYVVSKNRKIFIKDVKKVYQAVSKNEADCSLLLSMGHMKSQYSSDPEKQN